MYSALYKSVLRAVNDLVVELQATTPTLEYRAWENRDDEDQLPRVPLIGISGFTWHENQQLWIVRFGITISTVDDANLLEEAELIDAIHAKFGEKKKIFLRDTGTGDVDNELVSVDFEVAPMQQTQMRNYRSIGIELRRTGT